MLLRNILLILPLFLQAASADTLPNSFRKAEDALAEKRKTMPPTFEEAVAPDIEAVLELARPLAQQIVDDYGQGAVPYLKQRLSDGARHVDSAPLCLAALEIIEPGTALADAVMPTLEDRKVFTKEYLLLVISYCSKPTRNAVADALAEKCRDSQWVWPLEFISVCGEQRAAELLREAADRVPVANSPFKTAADRIRARLSLPEDLRKVRAEDELIFWQALSGAPIPRDIRSGFPIAAARAVAHKKKISLQYLIEILQGESGPGPAKWLAIDLIVAQKQRDAIPWLQRMAEDMPALAEELRSAVFKLDRLP